MVLGRRWCTEDQGESSGGGEKGFEGRVHKCRYGVCTKERRQGYDSWILARAIFNVFLGLTKAS